MADTYDVFFATNRDFNDSLSEPQFGNRFNKQGPQIFRVGRGTVERMGKDDYKYRGGQVEDEDETRVGSQNLFPALRDILKDGKMDILIYVHGFASTFEISLERVAQLSHEYVITPRSEETNELGEPYSPAVFAFSWPSNGKIFPASEYQSDRDDAQVSGVAMARALLKLLKFLHDLRAQDKRVRSDLRLSTMEPLPEDKRESCKQHIHVVAHSMGNWALRHAVNRFADEVSLRPLPRIFEHVFLMAADEDDDALEDPLKLGLLPDLGKFIHVYHSRSDRALDVSDLTKGNPNRLGEAGPRNMDIIMDRIDAIDCTKVDFTTTGDGNHQYYRLRDEVIQDVRQVISGVPTDRIEGRVPAPHLRSWRILSEDER
jgi:esterase/lipase superfamily enzyme